MKRRLIYLSSLTLTVVVNLTLASAWRMGREGGGPGGLGGIGGEREEHENEGGRFAIGGRMRVEDFKCAILTRGFSLARSLLARTWTMSKAHLTR